MTLPKQKFREIVFLALFSMDMGNEDESEIVELIMEELKVTKKQGHDGYRRALEIFQKREDLDTRITEASTAYEFERIPSVERNVLRLGLYEMLVDEELPDLVAIAEAIRLSRKFSTPESSSFVNAILDNLLKKYGRGKQAAE